MMKKLLLIVLLFFTLSSSAAAEYHYFVGDVGECVAYLQKLNKLAGYPNPATKTDTIAQIRVHQDRADQGNQGKCFIFLKGEIKVEGKITQRGVWSPKLNRRMTLDDFDSVSNLEERTTNRKTRTELEVEGAFPIEIDP